MTLLSSAVFRLQNRVSDYFLICFAREIKGFYQSSLENEVDFREIMNISHNIFVKIRNSKKLRRSFLDERSLITTTLISSCNSKTLVPFCLLKKRTENAFLTPTANYRKIVYKNKSCYPKQE